MGQPKAIKSPDVFWKLFLEYKKEIETNPFTNTDWVGGAAIEVKRKYIKTLTMEGFECFVMNKEIISYPDLTQYFERKKGYESYFPVAARIKREIRRDQIEKGLAGLANQSITARITALAENVNTNLSGGLNIPDIGDRE